MTPAYLDYSVTETGVSVWLVDPRESYKIHLFQLKGADDWKAIPYLVRFIVEQPGWQAEHNEETT